jgi:hypothetical protein
MLKTKSVKNKTLLDVVEALRARRDELNDEIDQAIETYIDGVAKKTVGVPRTCLRFMECDARASGLYSPGVALENLYQRLLNP